MRIPTTISWTLLVIVLSVLLSCLARNGNSYSWHDNFNVTLQRDSSLISLAELINKQQDFFRKWSDTEDNYIKFFKSLEPWIFSNISRNVDVSKKPILELNCRNPHYSGVLTGKELTTPRVIVDFVPFGYELDKLLIRLHETADFIDLFVIYESARTQSGLHKPLYLSKLRSKRNHVIQQWLPKILHFTGVDTELASLTARTRASVSRKRSSKTYDKSDLWALETAMRTRMVEKFLSLDESVYPLKARVMRGLKEALGIQNDADEIIKGEVLFHLKHCELKKGVSGIYTPSFHFKRNFHWMEESHDLGCLAQPSFPLQADMHTFTSRLWRPGPYLYPLSLMLGIRSTNRKHTFETKFYCHHHMGLGAAVHISSVADPVDLWMKRCGVIEQDCTGTLSREFIAAARNSQVTPDMIFKSASGPLCSLPKKDRMLFVPNLRYPHRQVFEDAVPWIVRSNPETFPFMLPMNATATGFTAENTVKKYGVMPWKTYCS
mmetsp:Transcript_423/g.439  ORF Transcript_423/g.439 Transcript_423/m.439 type:complete len:492 (+) Transcript_423:120-1595(+)